MPKHTLLSIIFITTFSANAELINSDWKVEGDNSLITDTTTELKWLAFNETYGVSVQSILTQNGIGQYYEGLNLPTVAEMESLTDTYLELDSKMQGTA